MPNDYYVSKYSGEEIDERLTAAHNAVRYDAAQSLNDAQKAQARGNIAAAPDGFGLGANGDPNPYTVVTGATIDALNASGLFWYRDTNTPIYPDGWNSGTIGNLLHIGGDGHNTIAERQIFYPYYPYSNVALNISCMRMKTDSGNWQPWEWVNPPMTLGVEFRTTERYLGKPVYKKLLLFTATMTDGYSHMAHNIANIANVVGCYAELFVGSTTLSTPILDGNNRIIFSATQNTIRKTAVGDYSEYSARVLMSYTKNTD